MPNEILMIIIRNQPDETVGRHSLANIWGTYSMDQSSPYI